jgi:hypothetical protein
MLKFRETLWFKKGELDAREAARAAGGEDDLAPGAVDLLPVEDRYRDDGSLTRTDSRSYGVHSGTTRYLREVGGASSISGAVAAYAERDMVHEMKRGTAIRLMVIGAGLLVLAVVLASLV